jgi:hypothetical protein
MHRVMRIIISNREKCKASVRILVPSRQSIIINVPFTPDLLPRECIPLPLYRRTIFQKVKMEIINVVMIINELGSPKAAIALLQVVHFQPSTHQRHIGPRSEEAYLHWRCMEPDGTWQIEYQSMDSYTLL